MQDRQIIDKSLPAGFGSIEELVTEGLVKPIIAAQDAIVQNMANDSIAVN